MNNNTHRLKIATLNCRGLKKLNNPKKRQQFIRFLRYDGYDILVLQETHANDESTIQQFNMQFQSTSSIWTSQTGIISLKSKFIVRHIDSGIDDGRFILADIILNNSNHEQTIATILNIYGRVGSDPYKREFFSALLNYPNIATAITQPNKNVFILGDFNYKSDHYRPDGSLPGAPLEWTNLLNLHFIDCFADEKQITWKSGNSSSIIDYIFCRSHIQPLVHNKAQKFISNSWTDHALLSVEFIYQSELEKGPGAWKGNPFLAHNLSFKLALNVYLQTCVSEIEIMSTFSSSQQIWDWIKQAVKSFVRDFQLEDLNWRKKQLVKLQRKRNKFLRQQKNRGFCYTILERTEQQISSLQEELAEIEILKAGKFW
ncbi:Endonuclease/exonuclease/phosphatase, partial [Pilaira anomala]